MMIFELPLDLIGQEVNDRVKISGFFLGANGKITRFDRNLAAMPVFIDRENQMDQAGPFQEPGEM